LNGLKLEADDGFIYVFDVDVVPATDKPDPPTVSIFITDAFIGEEVNPEKRHHQAYTPMGEKKPGVVYKRKDRKAEDRIQPIAAQLPEEFCIIHNITGDPLEDIPVLPTHPPDFIPGLQYTQERHDKLQLNPDGFLWPEEEKLAHHLVREEDSLSWIKEEKGKGRVQARFLPSSAHPDRPAYAMGLQEHPHPAWSPRQTRQNCP
jgi:hypothetical protein